MILKATINAPYDPKMEALLEEILNTGGEEFTVCNQI